MKDYKNIIMDKKDLEKILKTQEVCEFVENTGKLGEILGFTTAAVGLFAKSATMGGIGLAVVVLSLTAKAIASAKKDKNEKEIEKLQGKSIYFVGNPVKKETSETPSEDREMEN